jgi:hypothetical protein
VMRASPTCSDPSRQLRVCTLIPCSCDDECPDGCVCNGSSCLRYEPSCETTDDCPDGETCTIREHAVCKGTPHVRYTCEPPAP